MRLRDCILVLATIVGIVCLSEGATAADPEAIRQIGDAFRVITSPVRPGHVGYATVWDGDKYVQCRHRPDHSTRCEAAGTALQPSLKSVLTAARRTRLAALGWTLDPSFGNYTRTFPPGTSTTVIAEAILETLAEAYAATEVEIETSWVADLPCPPRNGPSQNLAGLINDAASMRATALRTCSYRPGREVATTAISVRIAETKSVEQLASIYGPAMTVEIERIRTNTAHDVYVVFSAGIGYIQCRSNSDTPTIYCEAQSAESWPALASVLTPTRLAALHKAGYSGPGRAPNYWKNYPLDKYNDAALAGEILTLLHDVYGYGGSPRLKIKRSLDVFRTPPLN